MSALWRPPSLRGAEAHRNSAVSWTELFYDLVFVVAVAHLGRRLVDAPDLARAGEFVGLFGMLWWAWVSVTFLVDRYESNDATDRLLAIAQMSGIAGFAAALATDPIGLNSVSAAIAASYTVTRLVVVGMYFRVWWHLEASRPLVAGYLRGFGLDTLAWALSIIVPAPWRYALWGFAMAISVATPWFLRKVQVRSPLSTSHLPERFGLFIILVLGESVAAVVASLQSQHGAAAISSAGAGLVVATGLWWIYFDNFDGAVVRRDPDREHDLRPTAWIYAHLPLAACLTMVGSGMAQLVAADEPGQAHAIAVICGIGLAGALSAMAVILLNMAAGDPTRTRRLAAGRLLGACVVAGATLASTRLAPLTFLWALGGVLVLEVILDAIQPRASRPPAASEAALPAHPLEKPRSASVAGRRRRRT